MPNSELTRLSVTALRDLLRRREVSALDATRAHLERIEALDDSTVQSLLTVTRDLAETQARAADERIQRAKTGRCSACR